MAGQYAQVIGRAETESGAVYQFTTHHYADGTQRTLMVRLPGRDGNTLGLDEPVAVDIPTNLRVGETLHLAFADPWDGEPRFVMSTPITRVTSWLVQ